MRRQSEQSLHGPSPLSRYHARILRFVWLLGILAIRAYGQEFAGAEACGACHKQQFESQSMTGHARALTLSSADQPGDWAFGSGAQAITFVSRVDRERYRELGATWFASRQGFGTTPGHGNQDGIDFRVFDSDARVLRCFGCHTTGPLTLDAEERIVPHELGVRCEVCHGPGGAHARNPVGVKPRNPARMTATGLNDFCRGCHRLDLETGEELTDVLDARLLRAQPLPLAASACYQASAGRLTCLTCHNPHEPLVKDAARYDAACVSCHTAPAHSSPVAGKACVSCHMPAVNFGDLTFRNHRIAVYEPGEPVRPVTALR